MEQFLLAAEKGRVYLPSTLIFLQRHAVGTCQK